MSVSLLQVQALLLLKILHPALVSLPDGWRYFRCRFHAIVAESRSVAPTRALYVHKTTATSTKEIKIILISIRDAILRHHLKESGFA